MTAPQKPGWRCEICRFCGRCFTEAAARPSASPFAVLKRVDASGEVDTTTGATPGVSSACKDFGFGDLSAVLATKGIKPPGEA